MKENKKKHNKTLSNIIVTILILSLFIFAYYSYYLIKNDIKDIIWYTPFFVTIAFAIFYSMYYFNKNKPRADEKWKEMEHGSNEFQTSDEKEEFLENCTDKINDFNKEEIDRILLFLNNEEK